MDLWFQAIFFGLVQGLTEYLPISSTAHVRIAAAFLSVPDPGAAFTAVTQVGTAGAVFVYFRKDLQRIYRTILARNFISPDFVLLKMMAIATIPIVIIGFLFADFFEGGARDLRIIAFALIFFGALLWLIDAKSKQANEASSLSSKSAVAIGLAQALALIPGVSRSGATITMARFLGFNRTAAARISFLLSLPAILLAAVYEMQHIGDQSIFNWRLTLIAAIVAFISGYLTIDFILKWITRHTFAIFAIYRFVLGVILISAISFFGLSPNG